MGWGRRPLTEAQVLAWADAHRAATGTWPSQYSGSAPGAPGEVWVNVNRALLQGTRGLAVKADLQQGDK
jgi:hypothetical protein